MAIDQTIMLKALEHDIELVFRALLTAKDRPTHTRASKTATAALFDRIAELLIAKTNLDNSGNPIDSTDTSAIQDIMKGYLRDALKSYKGTILAKSIGTSHDSEISDVDDQITEFT